MVHATVKVATTYQKKKYCLEVSSSFGEQFYLQADTQKMMDDWYISIYKAIEKAVSDSVDSTYVYTCTTCTDSVVLCTVVLVMLHCVCTYIYVSMCR